MRVWWSDEAKINCLRSDGRHWVWKEVGEGLSDRVVEGAVKFEGGSVIMWGCMGWDMQPGLRARWMQISMYPSWKMSFKKPFTIMAKPMPTLFSNRTTTPSILARRPRTGSKTMESVRD